LLVGCGGAVAKTASVIPGTNVTVEELLLLPGTDRAFAQTDRPTDPLCASQPLASSWRGSVFYLIDRRLPFDKGVTATERPCRFEFREVQERSDQRYDYTAGACAFRLTKNGDNVRRLQLFVSAKASPDEVRECAVRQGFFVLGYGGALTMPRAKLFRSTTSTLLAGHETLIGRTTVHPIVQFLRWCAPLDGARWGKMSRAEIRREITCRSRV